MNSEEKKKLLRAHDLSSSAFGKCRWLTCVHAIRTEETVISAHHRLYDLTTELNDIITSLLVGDDKDVPNSKPERKRIQNPRKDKKGKKAK